ncbi:MAG TPA: AAA family ATPase, partial [Deltaproteobacteria bacterium]|nr:AAA family ATPase [Deltaproteobacteria bacterium]
GTYPLPEAQLDRFLLKVRLNFPSADMEAQIVETVTSDRVGDGLDVSRVAQVVSPQEARTLQQVAARVTVDPRVVRYAVDIVRATRTRQGIVAGAGPRGGI